MVKFFGAVSVIVLGAYGFDTWVESKIEDKTEPLESQIESLDRSKNAQYGIIRNDLEQICQSIDSCHTD